MTSPPPHEPETRAQFKAALRLATRDAGFTLLNELEQKTGLSHSTVSSAFSSAQPMPSAKTVHVIVTACHGSTAEWELRREAADQVQHFNTAAEPATPHVADVDKAATSGSDSLEDGAAGDGDPNSSARGRPADADAIAPATADDAALSDLDAATTSPDTTDDAHDSDGAGTRHRQPLDSGDASKRLLAASADFEKPPTIDADHTDGPDTRKPTLRRIAVAALAVIVVAGAAVGITLAVTGSNPAVPTATSSSGAVLGGGLPTRTGPPARTYPETVIPENAAPTLKDPLTARGLGQKVPANATVQVSCRIFSDAIPSAIPDGYFLPNRVRPVERPVLRRRERVPQRRSTRRPDEVHPRHGPRRADVLTSAAIRRLRFARS